MAEHSGSGGPGSSDAAARDAVLGRAAAGSVSEQEAIRSYGQYRVLASIGRGGMGEILLAHYRAKGKRRLAALKVLPSDDDELVRMFMDEAALMARIHSPHVLEVFEFGRHEGSFFLAMEYLEGRPLVRVMIDAYQHLGGLDYALVAALGAGAAEGLADAHEAKGADGKQLQIVHRDISPQNVFVTYAGVTKVIDFGVARARERLTKTAVGHVKGKAAYMSPEQVEGREQIDGRSDVFSLAICLWEMTAGRRLFKRDSDYETMLAVSEGPIVSPTKLRRRPDPELDRIILSGLERDPKKRPEDARVFARALEGYAAAHGAREPQRSIAALMQQLFGEEAEKERQLLATLIERTHEATANEVEALRTLSGISPMPGPEPVQEVTLIGRPQDLVALDRFRAPMDEDSPTILVSQPPPPRATSGVPRLSPAERADVVERAVRSLNEQYQREKMLQRAGAPKNPGRRSVPRRVRGLAVWAGRLAIILVAALGGAALWLVAQKAEAPTPPIAVSSPPPLPAPPPAVIPARPRPVREVVPKLSKEGLSFDISAGIYLVRDGRGGAGVPIAWEATYAPVAAHGFDGAFFRSLEPGTVRASFIGRTDDGPLQIQALSVNDCAAEPEAIAEGFSLRYGAERVLLSARPLTLHRARIAVPRFADRIEMRPLGLSFGREEPGRSTIHCQTGLKARTLELERVPAGQYEFLFLGEGREEHRTLVLPEEEKKPKRRRRASRNPGPG